MVVVLTSLKYLLLAGFAIEAFFVASFSTVVDTFSADVPTVKLANCEAVGGLGGVPNSCQLVLKLDSVLLTEEALLIASYNLP